MPIIDKLNKIFMELLCLTFAIFVLVFIDFMINLYFEQKFMPLITYFSFAEYNANENFIITAKYSKL